MKVLLFVGSTLRTRFRSGIQRVTVEIAGGLVGVTAVDFVKWDPIDAQLRYLDRPDLANLFGNSGPEHKPHPMAHRVHYRFGDTIKEPDDTWLLIPEVSYHDSSGADYFARSVSQAREHGIRTAAIFYDLIPITNDAYREFARRHVRYTAELLRFDRILAISATSAKALEEHYRNTFTLGGVDETLWLPKIVPLLLPEINSETRAIDRSAQGKGQVIVLVGTVEPRKRQVEVLEAITSLQESGAISPTIETRVLGSLHPAVSSRFRQVLKANPRIRYFEYADAAAILSAYRQAMFSIFASNDEGYGLPIAESLAAGVPCLTANFGAMAEVAEGGGCFTCDINDTAALATAIRALCTDDKLQQRLRSEIASRPFRDWTMYCRDLVEVLKRYDSESRALGSMIEAAVTAALVSGHPEKQNFDAVGGHQVTASDAAPGLRIITVDRVTELERPRQPRNPFMICRFLGSAADAAVLAPEALDGALKTDLWGVLAAEVVQNWIDQARREGFPALLPGEAVIDANSASLHTALAARAKLAILTDRRRHQIAQDERLFSEALKRWKESLPEGERPLAIVVSTYNRGPFIEINVGWLIDNINRLGRDVQVIVVDNASTDDTVQRLSKFAAVKFFSLIVNPQNTGMLGNMRMCSTLSPARHVWMTGDDDFILPEQLETILKVLDDDPGLPLGYVNFAVYYRQHLDPGDNVQKLLAERHVVGKNVLPSGTYPVNVAAAQHDNMFTAMYLLIFRSDLFAACFNHPFDGILFDNLTECIPTTRWFLENYRYVDCYWNAPVSIVGNAHNSWTRHRPRWHGVIMPQVFELARDAGSNSVVLNEFAQVHISLYDEAIQLAADAKLPIPIAASETGPARRVFRKDLAVPEQGTRT
jgi:glycosyltransferase involved in cell wall biosynthesis